MLCIQKGFATLTMIYNFYHKNKHKRMPQACMHLYDENKYVAHIGTLQKALNHGLILKKVHGVIKFN